MIPEKEMPFRVVTQDDVLVKGYMDEDVAKSSATDRNKDAEKLGIKSRYSARAL